MGGVSADRTREGISGFGGLRAIAALTVVSYHVASWSGLTRGGWFAPIWWELKGGVVIFFVISGALLYLPYARALRDGSGLPGWRRYARRRAVRILPAYWVALTALAVGPFHAAVFGPDAWRYYSLSQIYTSHTRLGGLGVAWSLCTEGTFYLVLPAFAWVAGRMGGGRRGAGAARVQLAMIGAAGLGSLALRGALTALPGTAAPVATLLVALPGALDWFAIGMALAVLRASLEVGGAGSLAIAALARRPGRCLLLAFAVFAAVLPSQQTDMFLPWGGLMTHVGLGVGSGSARAVGDRAPSGRCGAAPPRPLPPDCSPGSARSPTASTCGTSWSSTCSLRICSRRCPRERWTRRGSCGSRSSPVRLACGAASWYLVERPLQRLFASHRRGQEGRRTRGRMAEMDAGVQSTLDPLNSPGVAVDHLA